MTRSRANAIIQSRTSDSASRAAERRLLADPEYIAIRALLAALPRTLEHRAERLALLERKYEIAERVGA